MKYQDFIKRIQETTGDTSPTEAKQTAETVLNILDQRLSRIHRKHLAAQLPGGLHYPVTEEEPSQHFPLEEFYNRVASRLGLNFHEAIVTSQGVMSMVVEAVTPGEINDIVATLPTEFAELSAERSQANLRWMCIHYNRLHDRLLLPLDVFSRCSQMFPPKYGYGSCNNPDRPRDKNRSILPEAPWEEHDQIILPRIQKPEIIGETELVEPCEESIEV
jgi:uncharacterized protein (DUF2267 family)